MTRELSRVTIFSEITHGRGDQLSLVGSSELFKRPNSDTGRLFPSEQWFYYWKAPASQWESLLRANESPTIHVPINWAFHCDDGDSVDFGEARPETDLSRLLVLAQSLEREIFFFLPLTPLPIFADGGVPRLLTRSPANDLTGLAHAYMDLDGRISKFYSFFDQRVFQAFQKYVQQLAWHFDHRKVAASVVGLMGGAIEREGKREFYISYLEDSSRAFDQGLSRFISKNSASEANFDVVDEEWETKSFYRQMIQQLYMEAAKEVLDDHWVGALDFAFLGGSPSDVLRRGFPSSDLPEVYARDLLLSLTYKKIPCEALLSESCRTPGMTSFTSQVITPDLIKTRLNHWDRAGGGIGEYDFLQFFEIVERPLRYARNRKSWDQTGLRQYLDKFYEGTYRINDYPEGIVEGMTATDEASPWVCCLFAAEMDEDILNAVLRTFLNGSSFVIDLSGVGEGVARKLECFVLENSLEVEVVKYKTEMRRVSLGEAQLVLFDGSPIEAERKGIQETFWQRVLSIFNFPRQELIRDEGVMAVWKRRLPIHSELNFAEIRRAIFYNPSDREKRVKIPLQKRFKLLRHGNHYRAEVENSQEGTRVSLAPDGCVAIDFGLID